MIPQQLSSFGWERERERERERESRRKRRTAQDGNKVGQADQEVENACQEADKTDKCSQYVSQEAEVAQAAGDVVAGEIGGSDNDIDQAEHPVVAMVRKESDCDSDEYSEGFDGEGFDDMYNSDEVDNGMAEEEAMKKFQFQSNSQGKWWTCAK